MGGKGKWDGRGSGMEGGSGSEGGKWEERRRGGGPVKKIFLTCPPLFYTSPSSLLGIRRERVVIRKGKEGGQGTLILGFLTNTD